uniref:Uncharacterized protein n=1 Tax=Physcomitrium patens TaxID=3218 RepID=A0A2K1JMF6_PHYPA|nr:hypothetical protein PHYPA_017547 [Physcomitrium patens]
MWYSELLGLDPGNEKAYIRSSLAMGRDAPLRWISQLNLMLFDAEKSSATCSVLVRLWNSLNSWVGGSDPFMFDLSALLSVKIQLPPIIHLQSFGRSWINSSKTTGRGQSASSLVFHAAMD